jgi:hypothetical protein
MELGIFKILNIDERGTKSDFDFLLKMEYSYVTL